MSESRIKIERLSRLIKIPKGRNDFIILPIKYELNCSPDAQHIDRLFFIEENIDSSKYYLRYNKDVDERERAQNEWSKQKNTALADYKKYVLEINKKTYPSLQEADIKITELGKPQKYSAFNNLFFIKNNNKNHPIITYPENSNDPDRVSNDNSQSLNDIAESVTTNNTTYNYCDSGNDDHLIVQNNNINNYGNYNSENFDNTTGTPDTQLINDHLVSYQDDEMDIDDNEKSDTTKFPVNPLDVTEFNNDELIDNIAPFFCEEYDIEIEDTEITADEKEYDQYVEDEKKWINDLVSANENDKEFAQYLERQKSEYDRYLEEEKKEKEWIKSLVADYENNREFFQYLDRQELDIEKAQNDIQESYEHTQAKINCFMDTFYNNNNCDKDDGITLKKFAQHFKLTPDYVSQILTELKEEMNEPNNDGYSTITNKKQEIEFPSYRQFQQRTIFPSPVIDLTRQSSQPNTEKIKKTTKISENNDI